MHEHASTINSNPIDKEEGDECFAARRRARKEIRRVLFSKALAGFQGAETQVEPNPNTSA
jgi:hypothetical protein